MKLTIVGGGGFRVPLVYGALLARADRLRLDAIVLHDVDAARLERIGAVLEGLADGHGTRLPFRSTTDLDDAIEGADFVFAAIRTGLLEGRVVDESVPLGLGVLGQETTGPGGLAYALRTVPVALDIAERTRRLAPDAWVINFTNPAGIVTEAMQTVLGDRVIGICDSPIALARRAMAALRLDPAATEIDYVGLNHLGWLRALRVDGTDHLPRLLSDPGALLTLEEGRLFGPAWLGTLGALPNEYLYYYYFTREALASVLEAPRTRGEFLLEQQTAFYDAVAREPGRAAEEWRRVREERDATYMREARAEGEERDEADVAGGGYEGVALALMAAISRGEPATMILNIRSGGAVPGLPVDAVVEVPCTVDRDGPHAASLPPLEGHLLGLVQQVKAVEQSVVDAVVTGSADAALRAFALHPLVDSVSTARRLLAGYRAATPEVDALLS